MHDDVKKLQTHPALNPTDFTRRGRNQEADMLVINAMGSRSVGWARITQTPAARALGDCLRVTVCLLGEQKCGDLIPRAWWEVRVAWYEAAGLPALPACFEALGDWERESTDEKRGGN